MYTSIDLRKNVRIHEALAEVLNKMQFKELTYETMFYLFAKITKSHKDDTTYTLDLDEFELLTGKQQNLSRYKDAIRELRSITIDIQTKEYDLIDGVISNAKFAHGKRSMVVRITPEMKPFLLDLVSNYTAPQLFSMMRLNSKHAKKLYLYFYTLRPTKGMFRTELDTTTITEFKINTGYINEATGEESLKKWSHFKDALDVAKDEINAVSDIKVAYYLKKWGREYYYITWHIENKNNEELIQLEEFAAPAELEGSFSDKVAQIGLLSELIDIHKLSEWQAKETLRQIDNEHLKIVLKRVIDADKKGAVKDMGGYTVRAIQNQFGINLTKQPKTPKPSEGINSNQSKFKLPREMKVHQVTIDEDIERERKKNDL